MGSQPAKCMKCDRPATTKITKIVKGKVYDILLCDEHAREFSPYLKKAENPASLVDLLQHILKQQSEAIAASKPAAEEILCPSCGLAFSAYRKTLLLGCSVCYDAFEKLLIPDLRKMHGATSHEPGGSWEPEDAAPEAAEEPPTEVPPEPPKPLPKNAPDGEAAAKAGGNSPDQCVTLNQLKEQMQHAIEKEAFDQAAHLRDVIRHLETLAREAVDPCPRCHAPLEARQGPQGACLVCSAWPACRYHRPV